ncbi:molybdopterin-guanine dinucleotide biosynthesis protein MobB [Paludibacterium denitrificans]|uniref:Molybdopterin-guanine dinucleotide biosynthesis protein B (MobB) domain-containing protein n=1 Tax=Paludibacterium denitrificans TaxID=2675226 RepID=A0A844GBH9_9NEIS|nr:molybdopterin-guanine dinucleotide biosynthesis protein MobB [Paludibacterium denitrificans]MTD32277.1 hypothetical protein [Paludibacterium denitrificans]
MCRAGYLWLVRFGENRRLSSNFCLCWCWRAWACRLNVIKHSHHVPVPWSRPPRDSARFRHAGAKEVMLATLGVIVAEPSSLLREAAEPVLSGAASKAGSPPTSNLIEGFKKEAIDRIEVWRAGNGQAATRTGRQWDYRSGFATADQMP